MSSKIIGRAACPECGFDGAHVKESEKACLYRYCPECGAQYFARTARQQTNLKKQTRLLAASASASASGNGVPPPTPPVEAPKRRGLFS